ncbi:WD40 repeat-like protein, partial [Coniophora puteana RWD-64-598 SS2]
MSTCHTSKPARRHETLHRACKYYAPSRFPRFQTTAHSATLPHLPRSPPMSTVSEVQQQANVDETQGAVAQATVANGGDLMPFSGHTRGILAIAYSPNGTLLATGSLDSTVRIWDANSGRQVDDAIHGHTQRVNSVSYSPDGTSVVSGSSDGTVRVWNAKDLTNTPAEIIEHTEGQLWHSVKFSPDGQLIAGGGSNGKLKVWYAREKTVKYEYKGNIKAFIWAVAWAPGTSRLATGCNDGKVRIYDPENPDVAVLLIEGHRGAINSVKYSPDGKLLASGSDDRTIRLWDAQTGTPVKSPFRGHKNWVTSVRWAPEGTRIVSGSADKTVRVWDVSRGQAIFKGALYGHDSGIWSVSYCPDGKSFASANSSNTPRVQVWDARTGDASLPLLSDTEHSALRKSPEAKYASGIISSEPGEMKAGASVTAIVWLPDGERFASVEEESLVRIWSAQTGRQIREITTQHEIISALSFSADGTKLAATSDDHTLLIFDMEKMQSLTRHLTGQHEAVYAVKLTPDGSRVYSGGKDKAVRVWDTRTGSVKHVLKAHTDAVCALSLAKDGS